MTNPHLKEKFIQNDKGKIFYWIDDAFPGKPTVIFLHGLSSNHTTWLKITEVLRENGYNSVAPDLRGHGLSDKSKNKKFYRLDVFSKDLLNIIEKEKIRNAILVGYSFGGQIAIDYVAKYPKSVNGLILISVNHVNPLEYRKYKFLTPVFYGVINLLAALLLWQKRKNYHYYQHGKAVGYWDSVRDSLRTMPLSVNFWMLAGLFKINLRESIKKIKAPTVIIYGENDLFIVKAEIDDMAKSIPKARTIVSKTTSHFIGTNSQDEIIEIILDFLSKI